MLFGYPLRWLDIIGPYLIWSQIRSDLTYKGQIRSDLDQIRSHQDKNKSRQIRSDQFRSNEIRSGLMRKNLTWSWVILNFFGKFREMFRMDGSIQHTSFNKSIYFTKHSQTEMFRDELPHLSSVGDSSLLCHGITKKISMTTEMKIINFIEYSFCDGVRSRITLCDSYNYLMSVLQTY